MSDGSDERNWFHVAIGAPVIAQAHKRMRETGESLSELVGVALEKELQLNNIPLSVPTKSAGGCFKTKTGNVVELRRPGNPPAKDQSPCDPSDSDIDRFLEGDHDLPEPE